MTKFQTTDARLVFDFPDRRDRPQRLCFTRPVEVIEARNLEDVRPALREVQRAAGEGFYAAGFVSYEAAPAFDRALVVRRGARAPLVWFGIFREPARLESTETRNATQTVRPASESSANTAHSEFHVTGWTPSIDRHAYEHAVATARDRIARGDTYQINYTFRMRARFAGDAYAFHRRLAARQRAPFCAYLDTGRFKILSVSPELFFRRTGREILTRPMKGTVRRGLWLEEDERLAAWLAHSEKNRAENIMIVDLLRNDLGRIAETASVRVEDLCRVERYPTLFQMTSTIAARLRVGITLEDTFAALFPCGSVTGAPKISTTRIIAALEETPRDIYCGSVGFITPRGEAVFNVAIRTVLIDAETGEAVYGTGGGITWDSTATDEYAEALTKAALLKDEPPEFELLETLRLERGEYFLLERHLRRLHDSARRLDFAVSTDDVRRALDAHAREFADAPRRVRLLVSRDGASRIESEPLEVVESVPPEVIRSSSNEVEASVALPEDDATREAVRVALAAAPVPRSELFLYHKTTRREVYERRRADDARAFDVLMWNEEGELTEFTNGNLVVELEGRRVTPPRECGLLAGTMRAELLERGAISEHVVKREDLSRCTRLWLINSVRGFVSVALRDAEGRRENSKSAVEFS